MAEVVRKKLFKFKTWEEKTQVEKLISIIFGILASAFALFIIIIDPLIIILGGFVISIRNGVITHWKIKMYESLPEGVTKQQEKEYNKYVLIKIGYIVLFIVCLIPILLIHRLMFSAIVFAGIEYYQLIKRYKKFQESDFVKKINDNNGINIPA